jgi:phospholipid/cholesterol/gamma-HCH transport system substrate-binding protein
MANRTAEIKVGLFVVVAVTILVIGIIWIKGIKFNVEKYRHSVIFPDIGALEIGDPVSVSGVKKGQVEKIELYKGDVLVRFDLTTDVKLKKDARFIIRNIGLMGERFIAVETGHSDTLLDLSQPTRGSYDTGIPEVMGSAGQLLDEVRNLVVRFNNSLGKENSSQSLENTLRNLNKASENLNNLVERNEGKIDQTLDNVSTTTSEFKNMLKDNREKFDTTLTNFSKASKKLESLTTSLEELSSSLKNLTQKIDQGEGTLGQLVNDKSLYDQLKRTAQNADSLIADIKKNPRKYIKLSIF